MSEDFATLLKTLEGRQRSLAPGQYLFHVGEPVAAMFVVLEGEIQLCRHQEDGHVLVLQRAGAGDLVAEASLFSDRYHCDAVATAATRVRHIPKRRLRGRLRSDPDLAAALAAHLAREIQDQRFLNEALSLRTIAARLDAWETWHGVLPPRGQWKQLARQIGVSPEALYREMARRRG